MNLRDLRYLLALVETRHFGNAAKQCHVSQPTLSGQIQKLEDELGVALFERSNRHVSVTDVGAQVARLARQILTKESEIRELAMSARDPFSGTLRLGAFPTLAPYLFPAIVQRVTRKFTALRLVLIEEKTESLIQQLRDGVIDAALLALPVEETFTDSEFLFEDPFFLAVPERHPLADLERVGFDEPTNFQLLLLEEGHCLRDQSLPLCKSLGMREHQDLRGTSLETLRQMVRAGSGITVIPRSACGPPTDGVRYIPFSEPGAVRSIGLFWRKTSPRETLFRAIAALAKPAWLPHCDD